MGKEMKGRGGPPCPVLTYRKEGEGDMIEAEEGVTFRVEGAFPI